MKQTTSDIVRKTYFDRFDEMDREYQLHYAGRLYAWSGDAEAKEKLLAIKSAIILAGHEARVEDLINIRTELAAKDFERDVNNYAARKPYFEKYPNLLLIHNALFRIRHWYCIYGIDERDALFALLPKQEIESMITSLQQDGEALRTLSTYVINLLYLYEKLYCADGKELIRVQSILDLKSGYDYSKKSDLQLLIYLYTHCLIGETLFYWQKITKRQDAYAKMLAELEQIINENYDEITLDNKFEFLVCARICNVTSALQPKIYDEAERSLNDEGFIVDRFNKNSSPAKQSFLMSEHRNVLYVMSGSAFAPHNAVV